MTVVLLILRIIGIALLVLLLLLLFLLLLVLFVPVCYRVKGSWRTQLTMTLRVNVLCSLFAFGLDMLPGKNDMFLRVLGFKKTLARADNTEEFEDTIEETLDLDAKEAAQTVGSAAQEFEEASVLKAEKKKRAQKTDETGERKAVEEEKSQEEKNRKEEKNLEEKRPDEDGGRRQGPLSAFFSRVRAVILGVRDKLLGIKKKLLEIRDKLFRLFATAERVKALFAKESNRQAVAFIWGRLFRLLQKICPKRFSLTAAFSTGAPDTTGELLGVVALFPFAYRQRWQITPDFTSDRFYVDVQFDVRGHLFVYQAIGLALSVLLDKNCRTLYNEIRNGS